MIRYLIGCMMAVSTICTVMGDCTLKFSKNRGHVSCTSITSEEYLSSIFEIKATAVNVTTLPGAGKISRISIEILNSHIPTIGDWLFLPWDDQFSNIHSVKIVNSSVSTVKPLSRFSIVETLDLSGNNVSDYRFLSKMKKLRRLYLSYTRFSLDTDNYLFFYLQRETTRLQLVDLSHSNLERFVTNLIDHYDLSFNRNLTMIQFNRSLSYRTSFLNFSGNDDLVRLEHLRSSAGDLCISLDLSNFNRSLDFLASNKIHISEKLLLNNNHLPSLDEGNFNFSKLLSSNCLGRTSIDVSHCGVTYISTYFFSSYTLNVLNLSKNNLCVLNGSIFRQSDILHLDLSASNISSISPSVFNYLTVETLDISRNNLSSLDGIFDYIESVSHLDVSANPIEVLNDKAFKNCRNLETLNLANVFVKSFKENSLLHLASLKVLMLSFKDAIPDSAAIKNIHVTDLTITNSTLARLEAEQFKGFYKLKRLTFVNCSASAIDNAAFKGLFSLKRLSSLKELVGSYDITVFQQLHSLETLDLSQHKLLKVGFELKDLRLLRTLNLSSNSIGSMDVNSFTGLKQLEVLSLSDNELSTIAVGTFRELTKLTHLYLNKNQLQQLVAGIFSGLDSLFLLDLSRNDLLRTKPHLILGVSVPKLTYLYLQGNGLGNEYVKGDDVVRRNEFHIIANHNKLKYLDINKNGWKCSTLIDVLAGLRHKNVSYSPTSPELTTSNINGVSCI